MQDGGNILIARNWHELFRTLDITVLPWAGKSLNLNPLQNLWGVSARSVHRNGNQYSTVEELKDAIVEWWNNLGQSFLDRSLSSMQFDCVEIIQSKRKNLPYQAKLKIVLLKTYLYETPKSQ